MAKRTSVASAVKVEKSVAVENGSAWDGLNSLDLELDAIRILCEMTEEVTQEIAQAKHTDADLLDRVFVLFQSVHAKLKGCERTVADLWAIEKARRETADLKAVA